LPTYTNKVHKDWLSTYAKKAYKDWLPTYTNKVYENWLPTHAKKVYKDCFNCRTRLDSNKNFVAGGNFYKEGPPLTIVV